MARFRLTHSSSADLERIFAISEERWGFEAMERYVAHLEATMLRAAARPDGPLTRDCGQLRPGLRSFHARHVRRGRESGAVKQPVHVVYYRVAREGLIEIVRVLHERMDPNLHLGIEEDDED